MSKIEIKKTDAYHIVIGDEDFGVFTVESKWEGFKKLVNGDSTAIIMEPSINHIREFLDMGEYTIIKASPDMCLAMKEHKKEEEGVPN